MSDIEQKLKAANGRLKANYCGVSIYKINKRLYIRGVFPPSPNSGKFWYGKPKNEFWGGSYTIIKPDSPMEVIKVPKSPHVVRIKLPKQSTVGAAGDVQDVKIFRNGKECGRDGVIGEGIPINKACTPDL